MEMSRVQQHLGANTRLSKTEWSGSLFHFLSPFLDTSDKKIVVAPDLDLKF